MGAAMKIRELRWRLAGHYGRPLDESWTAPLRDAHALEVGGPSALFSTGGLLPVYPRLASLDGVQVPRAHALWHGELSSTEYETGEAGLRGTLWLREGSDLAPLADDSYDAVISSHVLEHFANPIGALREWLRVLRPGGWFLMVLPHKEGCADHRRPTTALAHLIDDDRRAVGEDDMTHVEETLSLHDISRDPAAGDAESARTRILDNPSNRAMHHHVFTTRSALELLDHVGLDLVRVESRWPHDIYVLARRPSPGEAPPDNTAQLSGRAAFLRRSPFRVDRREGSR
jgi:SAM-dependent methyltransferase